MDWQDTITILTALASLVLIPLCAYFLGEIKDLRRSVDDRKEEISKIRESFATQGHLSNSENRIMNYIDTRFRDLGDKFDTLTSVIERAILNKQ